MDDAQPPAEPQASTPVAAVVVVVVAASADAGVPGSVSVSAVSPALEGTRVLGARRALGIFGAFLLAQLAVAGVVGAGVALWRVRGGGSADGIDARVTMGAAFGGTLLAGLVVLRMLRRTLPGPLAGGALAPVGWRPATARQCGHAALTGLALVVAFLALAAMLPITHPRLGPLARAAQLGGWARLAWSVLAVACAPPLEELVFRGALYAGLARAVRPGVAGAVTTAIFVALHLPETGAYWPAWLAIGALGALALRARLRSGSLLPAIALHASYNLVLVLAVYAR